ncbi:MAG: N-acetylmuramoyl-L-alanine amidase [Flavobacteriales bacterium]|nr:N-acetylmuramoyl-L-alanine amidase [Flavobacteriales bacterium]
MKRFLLLIFFIYSAFYGFSINFELYPKNNYSLFFESAYKVYPDIPKGLLEAVSYTQTRFVHFTGNQPSSCLDMPKAYTLMGLTLDGKNYFRNNLTYISSLSGISETSILDNPEISLLAYAKAFSILKSKLKNNGLESNFEILRQLSELPMGDLHKNFAMDSYLYAIYWFLTNPICAKEYGFPEYSIDYKKIFGENFSLFQSEKILITEDNITDEKGEKYKVSKDKISPDYPSAIWDPAPSCNYSSRNGIAISAITIHTIQGSYAGAISWAKNCNSNVSYHYVIRSIDGQITQMVLESNKAWHVGSENPYTIGYEHEGYVNQPGWYTNFMYNASADLTKHICNKNYGINPLRTFQGPATSGLNLLGSCIRIKGHQHYPNQNHTDPGIYWDWEKYYQLINNNPSVTNYTNNSGSFYDSGGPNGNYSNDERKLYLIHPNGVNSVTLSFSQFNLETNWDYLRIYDGNTLSAPLIGKYTGTNSPGTVTSTGNSLLVEFRSDCATTASGWAATWTSNLNQQQQDSVPPTTSINTTPNWVTQDFNVAFTDQDNIGGSGLEKSYYQILEFNGTEWRANETRGFFSDNFDLNIHPDWSTVSGNWSIQNSHLMQSDEGNGNTNIFASLNQILSNRYLYHWAGKIEGAGTNRRAGFHFFCDNASLTNRGNSYFVWFRADDNKLQFYKVVNDVFSMVLDVPYTFNPNQWYDFKVIFDRITGKISMYINNTLSANWTDPNPHTTGNQISFRSGNCKYSVNNLKVYRSRYPNVMVTVGAGNTNDLRYQNPNPSTPAGLIKSIVADSASNLSNIAFIDVNVDWTSPSIVVVNDGIGNDIDTTYVTNELSANWNTSFDTHSGISSYYYSVGTSPGDSDIVAWKYNWNFTSTTDTGLTLNYNQTYYYNVKAVNGAGLISVLNSSNGQTVIQPTLPPMANFSTSTVQVCEGDPIIFYNNSLYATNYLWNFQGGNPLTSTATNPSVLYTQSGNYAVELIAYGPGGNDTLVQIFSINVIHAPQVSFNAIDTTLYLPSAIAVFNNTTQNASTWYWDFGDGNTSTDKNPWHQYAQAGLYTVQLTANNGVCPNKDLLKTDYINVNYPLSVGQNNAKDSLRIFPNPFINEVFLILNSSVETTIELFLKDVTGKILWISSYRCVAGTNHIAMQENFENILGGIYLLDVKNKVGKSYRFKLIKTE